MVYDITIVGAGIVGLSTGIKLLELQPDLKLLIIDKEASQAAHQAGKSLLSEKSDLSCTRSQFPIPRCALYAGNRWEGGSRTQRRSGLRPGRLP